MKPMNDNDFDLLLAESAKRRQSVEHINAQVMQTVRRDLHVKAVRKWTRLLGICLGLPLAVVVYVWVLWEVIAACPMQTPLRVTCIALPLITIAAILARNLKNYRLDV